MNAIAGHLDLLLLGATCIALMAGFPVAFTLGGLAVLFAFLANLLGADVPLGAIPNRIFGIVTNQTLLAVPLFVLMGHILERSQIAEDLVNALGDVFSRVPGGLALSVTMVGGLLAASTGIVGATVVTLGLIALPGLLKAGYGPRFSSGSVAAAGTLGQIIPPSIVLVVLSDQISNASQTAQRSRGLFSTEPFSVADLFAAALLPGVLLVGLYLVLQIVWSRWTRVQPRKRLPGGPSRGSSSGVISGLLPPLFLVLCVLGSILAGIATATEAAAVGVIGALVLAGARQSKQGRWLLTGSAVAVLLLAAMAQTGVTANLGRSATGVAAGLCLVIAGAVAASLWAMFKNGMLKELLANGVQMTAMIFAIMFGATMFALVFRELGGDETIAGFLEALPGGTLGAIFFVMLAIFLLGFFLDFLEIVFVVVPLVAPVLLLMEMPDGSLVSPAWLAVMIAINLQTSFLTPPFGFALFYLRGVTPDGVSTRDIYLGAAPFVAMQLLMLVFLWFWPALALWLPERLYG